MSAIVKLGISCISQIWLAWNISHSYDTESIERLICLLVCILSISFRKFNSKCKLHWFYIILQFLICVYKRL